MASTSKAFNQCVDPCPRYLRWHTQSLRLLFGQGARTRCPWGENLCATSSTFAGRRHMIGKVVTGCVAILSYHTATQDRGSECRDFGFISRIVTALHIIVTFIYRIQNVYTFKITYIFIIYNLNNFFPYISISVHSTLFNLLLFFLYWCYIASLLCYSYVCLYYHACLHCQQKVVW